MLPTLPPSLESWLFVRLVAGAVVQELSAARHSAQGTGTGDNLLVQRIAGDRIWGDITERLALG